MNTAVRRSAHFQVKKCEGCGVIMTSDDSVCYIMGVCSSECFTKKRAGVRASILADASRNSAEYVKDYDVRRGAE